MGSAACKVCYSNNDQVGNLSDGAGLVRRAVDVEDRDGLREASQGDLFLCCVLRVDELRSCTRVNEALERQLECIVRRFKLER